MIFLSNMSYIENSNISWLMKQADKSTFCPPLGILLTLLWQGAIKRESPQIRPDAAKSRQNQHCKPWLYSSRTFHSPGIFSQAESLSRPCCFAAPRSNLDRISLEWDTLFVPRLLCVRFRTLGRPLVIQCLPEFLAEPIFIRFAKIWNVHTFPNLTKLDDDEVVSTFEFCSSPESLCSQICISWCATSANARAMHAQAMTNFWLLDG